MDSPQPKNDLVDNEEHETESPNLDQNTAPTSCSDNAEAEDPQKDVAPMECECSPVKAPDKPSRKRKYLFKDDENIPKRFRKFYFLNKTATKPRKSKLSQAIKTQKEQELEPLGAPVVPSKQHKLHFAKADCNGNLFLTHRLHAKSDLFFKDEKKCNYEEFKKLDLAYHVVDEIALEGLDGITLEAFWKRLKTVFPNNISKAVADRIWRVICNNKRVNFYILKEPREKLVFLDRCKYFDIDSGMFLEPFIEIKDIYPMSSVNGTDVRGSCATFHTRKENNGVRRFSMDKAIKLYDQRLVFVADQTLRSKALINEETDPNIELMDVEYCMLEKIGRSRYQGEFTQGKMSLANDGKKIYHNRKHLVQHSLIVVQNFSQKSLPTQQNMSGGLVHLSRFYHKRKTKHVAIMERIAHILKTRPNCQMEFTEFRKIFGRNVAIVKLVKTAEFRRFFKVLTFPFRKVYPNATKQEYLNKNKTKERQIRILRMIDPCANVTVLLEGKEPKEVICEKIDDSPGHKLINYEYMRNVFLYILSCGKNGATIQEIHEYLKTDYYSVRMAIRKMLCRNVISSVKVDLGRQQSLKFFAKRTDINTTPKTYELTEETLCRILPGYRNPDLNGILPMPATLPNFEPVRTQFKLSFEPFCCMAFLTEAVDAYSEESTIYDIVNKGRDKLLLIESNLFAHYDSEWDGFFVKRDDFSKELRLLQQGFGKVIYDFLNTLRIGDCIKVDNQIVFNKNNITCETRISRPFSSYRIISLDKNYSNPHSSRFSFDLVAKIYVFEAMFNSAHRPNRCIDKLQSIFERLMISEGKRRTTKTTEQVIVKPEVNVEVEVTSNVTMEKFMGSTATLEWIGQEEEITIEIYASTKPQRVMMTGKMFTTDDVSLTRRYINRANLILKAVYSARIVLDVRTLYKDILKEEGNEGYDKKACKKSIVSIVTRLVEEGYIKCYKIVMNAKNLTRSHCFVCVHEIESDHPLIRSTIEEIKLKFYVGSSTTQKITIKKKCESPFNMNDVKESISELRQLTNIKTDLKLNFDRAKGKAYGYAPKFVKMQVLHQLLFYIVRDMKENEPLSNRQVFELCKNVKMKVSPSDITEMPPVYLNEVSWKMFIPMLPQHNNWPKGWVIGSDIVLRMPLSLFVKLHNITYDVPELEPYLSHPIKRHYLVKYLPTSVRNVLLYNRKYFHSIYDTITNLCYVGLLQLGARNFKEKDQLFMYLNTKATLYDTCNSKPGYNLIENKKYKKIPIEFKSGSDVEMYWSELLRISMNTSLGKRKILDGRLVTIEDSSSKPELLATLKARSFEEAVQKDTGHVPGDRRGGAGVDSSLWSYLKRNWVWNVAAQKPAAIQSKVKKDTYDVVLPEPIRYDLVAKGGPPERKVYLKSSKSTKKTTKLSLGKVLAKKKFMRRIVAPRKKRVREYCDAVDRRIMKRNPGLKVDWNKEEEQLLRYCRIALIFLCPILKRQFIPYNILRDVLHRIRPKSKNKTARAIQRRIYVLLTNDETMKIMETNIENLLNSDTICKYLEPIHNRYKHGTKVTDQQLNILFAYLMSYICKHKKEIELLLLGFFASFDYFSDANISDFDNLLQSCDNANSSVYTNPKTVEDVTKDTLKSVIHCSMSCRKNNIGWSYLLSRIYKKFPDDLVRSTLTDLKKNQFFVQNKSLDCKNVENTFATPIKFSRVYNMMKTTSYTTEIYRNAYKSFAAVIAGRTDPEEMHFVNFNELTSFWERTTISFDIPEMGIILNPEIDDHSEVIEELAKRLRMYLDQIYQKSVCTKTKTVTPTDIEPARQEISLKKIKAEVRHLIFRIPYPLEQNIDIYFKNMLNSNSNLEISNYIFLMIVDLKNFAKNNSTVENLKLFINSIEDENLDDQDKLMQSLSKVVFAIQNMSQHEETKNFEDAFGLWETKIWNKVRTKTNENTKSVINKYYTSGMENCIKRAQECNFPSLEEIKEGMMAEFENVEERQIPHITDLIMLLNEDRFPDLDTDVETREAMKEHFVVQYPKMNEFVIEDLELMLELDVTRKILDDRKLEKMKKMTENFVQDAEVERIPQYVVSNDGTASDITVTFHIIDFIKGKRELGVPAKELKDKFADCSRLNLVKLLEFLTEINVVLKTGICEIIYVHHEFQSEWLTETFFLSQKEKEMFESKEKQEIKKGLKLLIPDSTQFSDRRKVQLKPWSRLDGSINNDFFHEWLCIILSRCIDFPNIPLLALCEQFHYIKPFDIYCLLEALQELGCVKIYVLNRIENGLVFKRCIVNECEATCLDSFEDMFVKPTNIASLSFGSFLEKELVEGL